MKGYTLQFCEKSFENWRQMTAKPHGERNPFHKTTHALLFPNGPEAFAACESFDRRNVGNFRVVAISQLSTVDQQRWFPQTS